MTACVDCGHQNPPSETRCQACNGKLHSSSQGQLWIDRLQEATDSHLLGQFSTEQLRSLLLTLEETLAVRAQDVVETIESTDYQVEHHTEVNVGIAGIQAVEQGLADLWRYQEDGNRDLLQNGLQSARQGLDLIREAMRLNREARNELAEQWIHAQAVFEHRQNDAWLEVA
ncbi:MAG: hypothetical protein ACYCW6_12885 [Candidatus Xenobia bacterium]